MEVNNLLNFIAPQQPALRQPQPDPRIAQEQARAQTQISAARFPQTTAAQDIPSDGAIEARLSEALNAKREQGPVQRGRVLDILA